MFLLPSLAGTSQLETASWRSDPHCHCGVAQETFISCFSYFACVFLGEEFFLCRDLCIGCINHIEINLKVLMSHDEL